MKKLTAILLATLMLVSIFASCGGNDETTTTEISTTEAPTTEVPTTEIPTTEALTTEAPTTETPTTEAPTTETPTTIDPNAPWSSKTDVRDTWKGKTLNVACSTWVSEIYCVLELCVKEGEESIFGTRIDNAIFERQKFVENTYGVKLNFLNATKVNMPDALEKASLAENINYDLCIPRMMNAQSIVAGGYVYDLANREFIDFRNSYYDENLVKIYTAHGHTFFAAGGFSIVEKETASVLFVNKKLLNDGNEKEIDELYNLVREDKWTFDRLVTYCEAAYSDNGDANDIFRYVHGLCCSDLSSYFDYFGVTQAGVNKATGEWQLTINDDKVDDIITAILNSNNAIWCKPYSGYGSWVASDNHGFERDKILFYNTTLNHTYLENEDKGVVPFPMLNENQGRYYVPCIEQIATLMCIPKITQDRVMSEYFMDVLCWTGEEYTMKAYIENKKDQCKDDADIEMITEYIIPNISYDIGEAVGWGKLIDIKYDSYRGNKNNFDLLYEEKAPKALEIIAEWNAAWGGYTEE